MKYFYFLIFLVPFTSLTQERSQHKLRLMISESRILPLTVMNVSTKETVVTDVAGYFSMYIKPEDELLLINSEFYQLKYNIKSIDLKEPIIRIYPESLSEVLNEVTVNSVTSKSLGLNSAEINKYIYKRNPNANMDFKAIFEWLFGKKKKDNVAQFVQRRSTDMNPYVAALPREVITNYLKIPNELVEKFYYYLNDDYIVDEYIKSGDEAKWRMHLLDKAFQFLEQENIPIR